jgi:hypothetical protein
VVVLFSQWFVSIDSVFGSSSEFVPGNPLIIKGSGIRLINLVSFLNLGAGNLGILIFGSICRSGAVKDDCGRNRKSDKNHKVYYESSHVSLKMSEMSVFPDDISRFTGIFQNNFLTEEFVVMLEFRCLYKFIVMFSSITTLFIFKSDENTDWFRASSKNIIILNALSNNIIHLINFSPLFSLDIGSSR